MQTNLIWAGREYTSLENCLLRTTDTGIEISATIVGSYRNNIYTISYLIKTNHLWETELLRLNREINGHRDRVTLETGKARQWKINGKRAEHLDSCIDIDISLTPFTNTLPINRLGLKAGEEQEISVIYFDLLKEEIRPAQQKYRRLSDSRYLYENVPNDFSAEIEVDEMGLVVDYPGLFVRTDIQSFIEDEHTLAR